MSDVGDPKQVKKRKTKLELAREKEIAYLKHVLSFPQGRDLVWRLLEFSGLYHTSFDHDSPHLTSFKEGKRHQKMQLENTNDE